MCEEINPEAPVTRTVDPFCTGDISVLFLVSSERRGRMNVLQRCTMSMKKMQIL